MTIRQTMLMIAIVGLLLAIPSCAESVWRALNDTTDYARGYSEQRFQLIRVEMSKEDVIRLMGRPLADRSDQRDLVHWDYGPTVKAAVYGGVSEAEYTYLQADATGKILGAKGRYLNARCDDLVGLDLTEMRRRYGEPVAIRHHAKWRYLAYSETRVDGSYYIRKVWLDTAGQVTQIQAQWCQD